MYARMTTVVALFALAVLVLPEPCVGAAARPAAAVKADFYVALDGNDAWSGKLPQPNAARSDGPFRTLRRAQDAVRQAKAAAQAPKSFTVLVRGGTYYLSEPLVIDPRDSGTGQGPVVWAAYPGERAIISGGRVIGGWRPGPGELWHADIPEVRRGEWYFRQLFVNGQRRSRARHPNDGYLGTAGPLPGIGDPHQQRGKPEASMGFTYREGDMKRWSNLEDVNIWLFHSWTASLHWIAELDEQNRVVRFTNRCNWPVGYWERSGQRYFVENFREALDQPGEWYLDRREGRLYYWPLPGEDMGKVTVVAPYLRHIVELRGEPEIGLPVEHVHFRDLSFQHADWVFEREDECDGQAAYFLDAAVYATGAKNCLFEGCEIAHVGEYGIWLSEGCRDNRIVQCHIHDLGGGGVKIGEPLNREGDREAGRNAVDNCFIHDGGHVFPAGVGVWIGRSSYNQVTHNEICDFYYTGISVGWCWGYAATTAHDNIVEYNHIHHIGLGVLSDMGGIYTLGRSPGTRLRYNLIHDIYMFLYGAGGIYPDEGSSNILIENNICYDTATGGFTQHYGRDNMVRNNIFAYSQGPQLVLGRAEPEYCPFEFVQNIAYSTTGQMCNATWGAAPLLKADYNCYWDTVQRMDLEIGRWFWEEWVEMGKDVHSVVADPLFVDAEHRDFRLRPDSPALKLGFKPIDMSRTGLYGPAEWRELPRRTPNRKPLIAPQPPAPRLTDFSEDFENVAVGGLPEGISFAAVGEERVEVTEELARSGKRCLKFVDAEGLPDTWRPHVHWNPFVLRRVVRVSFDVRLGERAILQHEWRDWRGSPYKVGPSLRFVAGGDLTANDRKITQVPVDRWMHVEIVCPVGLKGQNTYRLTVQAEGAEPVTVDGLPFGSQEFRALTWLGFISDATVKSVIYLDNVELKSRNP